MPPKPAQKPKPPVQPKPEPKKPEPAKPKQEPKKEDKTPPVEKPKAQEQKVKPTSDLKSVFDSVDAMKAEVAEDEQKATIATGTNVQTMGIDGGNEGSYFSELSITEIDALASRLHQCWNLEPGAMGLKDMVIEVRVSLNRDGSVRDVGILDEARYNSDQRFRPIAEGAVRAVKICASYTIFTDNYADKYEMWKSMKIKFYPFDGSIR